MNTAAALDVLVSRAQVPDDQVMPGKQIVGKVLPLLLGLRGYLDESE